MSVQPSIDPLKRALRSDPFTAADRAFVQFLEDTYEENDVLVLAAAALCLAATREGHSFLDLSNTDALPPLLDSTLESDWPEANAWQDIANRSPSIGTDADSTPMVLVGQSALYLRKYYEYEKLLADSLIAKATQAEAQTNPSDPDTPSHTEAPSSPANESEDLQQSAVSGALANRLYIISGGPGTGKTTTVLEYLARAITSHSGKKPLRIAAAAPTGKAATRLSESIRSGISRLDLDPSVEGQLLRIPCLTVHRLLQGLPNRISFRRNRKSPLEYDVIVVDETSMIDLPLMQKLMDAVPADSSIVFLGDHHQLSSVEVGSVFGDLTRSAHDSQSPLYQKSTTLTKTYRFSEDSSIYRFCEICKQGDTEDLQHLLDEKRDDFTFRSLSGRTRAAALPIVALIEKAHQSRLDSTDLESAFESLGHFITLTPFNRGDLGASALNRLADSKIRRIHGVDPISHYPGMPLIILENNYDLELFNGDMGMVWPDPDSGKLFAWFSDAEKGLKRVRLGWLPKHELAYCLTIHKSQGSEFDEVAGVFPSEGSEFVSKELIYTCASRAKRKFTLFGETDFLNAAILRSVERATRLEEQIR